MHLSLATLTFIEWGSLITATGLGFRAAFMNEHQAKRSRAFVRIAVAIIVVLLVPAVFSAWSVFGDFPVGSCPECSPVTIVAIWSTMLFTVALVMAPIVFVIYLLSLSKG